jgi:hypothetical protein
VAGLAAGEARRSSAVSGGTRRAAARAGDRGRRGSRVVVAGELDAAGRRARPGSRARALAHHHAAQAGAHQAVGAGEHRAALAARARTVGTGDRLDHGHGAYAAGGYTSSPGSDAAKWAWHAVAARWEHPGTCGSRSRAAAVLSGDMSSGACSPKAWMPRVLARGWQGQVHGGTSRARERGDRSGWIRRTFDVDGRSRRGSGALAAALRGCDAVVNLVGIKRRGGRASRPRTWPR